MKSKKIPFLNILIILAMLLSFTAVTLPAAPVQADVAPVVTTVTALTPHGDTTSNPAYVKPGGSITVNFAMQSTDNGTYQCTAFIVQGSTSYQSAPTNIQDNGSIKSLTVTAGPTAPTGYYNAYVTVGTTNSATVNNAVYVDATTPVANVIAPNLCWKFGSVQTISYTVSIPGITGEKLSIVTVALSGVGTIKEEYNVTQGTHSFNYTANTELNASQLTITATSQAGNVSTTTYFPTSGTIQVLKADTIHPSVPTISGTSFTGGAPAIISFNALGTTSTNFTYMLVLNKGDGNTENITPGWYTPTSITVQYNWTVSNTVTSSNCSITAWIKDCAGNVSSPATSGTFSITSTARVVVSVLTPARSSVRYSGASENITWSINNPLYSGAHTCTVYYNLSDNASTSWQLASITSQGNSGSSYWATWAVPTSVASTTTRIKIEAQAPAGNSGIGYSDLFSIVNLTTAPTITFVSPAVGTNWTAGTTQNIQWKASGTPATTPMNYRIYLIYNGLIVNEDYVSNAPDGSLTILYNRAQCPSTACTYAWTIPSALPDTTYPGPFTIRIMASYYVGPGPQEQLPIQADSPQFNIVASATACPTEPFTVNLYPGWNLVSLQAIPENSAITSILAGVMNDVLSVWYFTGGNNGTWQNFIPAIGTGTLTTMTDGKAYWIQMSNSYTSGHFSYRGRKCPCGGSTPMPYYAYNPGWNMVGFKSTTPKAVNVYMPYTCGVQYAKPIYGYDASSQESISVNCADNMTPGAGYWIYFGVTVGVHPGCD